MSVRGELHRWRVNWAEPSNPITPGTRATFIIRGTILQTHSHRTLFRWRKCLLYEGEDGRRLQTMLGSRRADAQEMHPAIPPGVLPGLLNPRDELTAIGMLVVGDRPGPGAPIGQAANGCSGSNSASSKNANWPPPELWSRPAKRRANQYGTVMRTMRCPPRVSKMTV
jgi:hypothetical protein